jgi:beta-xylosidase
MSRLLNLCVGMLVGVILAAGATVRAVETDGFIRYVEPGSTDNPLLEKMGRPSKAGGFSREGFHLWDPSIIKVGDTWHLFASCWPSGKTADVGRDTFNDWKKSYVIRAVSKDLLGPYTYVEDVLHPRPGKFFDSTGCHNPKITSHGGKFYLYHLGIPAWKSGVAVSDSIAGPWTRRNEGCIPANNPAVWIHEDGSVYVLNKAKVPNPQHTGSRASHQLFHYLQAMKSDSIFGPYQQLQKATENALPDNYEHEDPTVWHDGKRYHVILMDWRGHCTGINKAFIYLTSTDGLKYQLVSNDPLIVRTKPIRFDDGSETQFSRIERPQVVLNEKGEVIAILAACLPQDSDKTGDGSRILVFPVDRYSAVK